MTGNEKKIEPLDIIELKDRICVSESHKPNSISQEPVNILFDPKSVVKKDVWEIDLIQILNMLVAILEKKVKKILKLQEWQHYHRH